MNNPQLLNPGPVHAWHFVHPDQSTYIGGLPVRIGETLTVSGPIIPRHRGLHAGLTVNAAYDAAPDATAGILCRVVVQGFLPAQDSELIAARSRKCIAMYPADLWIPLYWKGLLFAALESRDHANRITRFDDTPDYMRFLLSCTSAAQAEERAIQLTRFNNPDADVIGLLALAARWVFTQEWQEGLRIINRARISLSRRYVTPIGGNHAGYPVALLKISEQPFEPLAGLH